MSSQEGRSPMDRKTAESLLRGDRAALGDRHPLTELLAMAKAPATTGELPGEAAALAAFRAAADSPGPATGRRSSMLARLLTVKVAAVAFATTAAVGGVALAASTGALPNPITTGRPSPAADTSHSPKPMPSPPESATPRPSSSAKRPKVDDLCREFTGEDRDHRRRALDDEHFRELVERAGARDRKRVDWFCGLTRPSAGGWPTGSRWPDTDDWPGDSGWPDNDNWPGDSGWPDDDWSNRSRWPSGRTTTKPTYSLPSGLPKTPQQHG